MTKDRLRDSIHARSSLPVIATLVAGMAFPSSTWADQFIQIGAHVDGRDRLIITGDTLRWHHFDYAAVGRHAGANSPTVIDVPAFHTEWIPDWKELPPAEIRFEAFSSTFTAPSPLFQPEAALWHATKFAGPGEVHILEQPSAANQFRLVLEFNDNDILGSSFYVVRLSTAQRVVIDLRPLSRSNTVTPGSTRLIQVAIMSNLLVRGFDATQLDPASVQFGPNRVGPAGVSSSDVNGDGLQDLVLSFRVDQTGISCGDSQVLLTAFTTSGTAIEGRDVLRTVNCQ